MKRPCATWLMPGFMFVALCAAGPSARPALAAGYGPAAVESTRPHAWEFSRHFAGLSLWGLELNGFPRLAASEGPSANEGPCYWPHGPGAISEVATHPADLPVAELTVAELPAADLPPGESWAGDSYCGSMSELARDNRHSVGTSTAFRMNSENDGLSKSKASMRVRGSFGGAAQAEVGDWECGEGYRFRYGCDFGSEGCGDADYCHRGPTTRPTVKLAPAVGIVREDMMPLPSHTAAVPASVPAMSLEDVRQGLVLTAQVLEGLGVVMRSLSLGINSLADEMPRSGDVLAPVVPRDGSRSAERPLPTGVYFGL